MYPAHCAAVLQVFSAIETVKQSLPAAGNEIYVRRIMGTPFYLPRFLADAVGLGQRRKVPVEQVLPCPLLHLRCMCR